MVRRIKISKIFIYYFLILLCCLGSACTIEVLPGRQPRISKKKIKKTPPIAKEKKDTIQDRPKEPTEIKEPKTVGDLFFDQAPQELVFDEDVTEEEIIEPEAAPEVVSEEDIFQYFEKAENYYNNFELKKAMAYYRRFLELNEDPHYLDDTLFRLGQIYFYLKNYEFSIQYFHKILSEYADSDFYQECQYYTGLNYFFLKDYSSAINLFEEIIPQRRDQKKLSELYYFNAKSHRILGNFQKAVHEFIEAINLTENEHLESMAKREIADIIDQKMNQKEIEEIITHYEDDYPSDLAQYKLAYYKTKNKDYDSLKEGLTRLLSDFPGFKHEEEVQNWLKGISAIKHSNEIKIGCILPLSGYASEAGGRILRGIRLAFNSFAEKIEGFEIRLVLKDSEGDPEKAQNLVKELAMIDNVSVIIGPAFSKSAFAAAKVAQEFRIPVFSPTASAEGLPEKSRYMFRNCMTNKSQGKAIAEYGINQLKLKRFVTLYPDNSYGKKLSAVFKKNVEKLGGQLIIEQPYSNKANDFSKEIKNIGGINDNEIQKIILRQFREKGETSLTIKKGKIASTIIVDKGLDPVLNKDYIKPELKINYDTVFIPGYFNKVGLITPELAFYNITGVKFIGANGWNSEELIKVGGRYVEGSVFVDGFFINSLDPAVKKFVRNYKNAFQADPDILSAQAYDAVNIIGESIRSGFISREGIRKYLSQEVQKYKGVSGVTTILPSGESQKELFYLKVKKGKIIQIHTPPVINKK